MVEYKANLYAIRYAWKDDPEIVFDSYLGVLQNPPKTQETWDAFFDCRIDNMVFHWMESDNEVQALNVGNEIEDGSFIVEIDKNPSVETQIIP